MSQGEEAAEKTKGFFKNASHATESLRQNINSFADDMLGSKSNTHSNTADTTASHTVNDPMRTGSTTTSEAPRAGMSAVHPTTDPTPAPGTLGVSDTSAGSYAGTHNTGLTGGGTTTGSHTASGIHPDAQRAGAGLMAAVDRAGEKLNESTNHSKKNGPGTV